MKKTLLSTFLILILAYLIYYLYPQKVITQTDGILVNEEPEMEICKTEVFTKNEFSIHTLRKYKIVCRILSKKYYSWDRESCISPVDVAVGWEKMSDNKVLKNIAISQSNRWYNWKTDNFPIPRKEIECSSANVHLIPKDEQIEDEINNIFVGNIVKISGYLVKVTNGENWVWTSSLDRCDTGDGACELFWVEKIEIIC